MTDTLDTFRKRMKSRRQYLGITLKEIAEYIDVKEATVQRYESGNGIKSIPYDAIIKIATLLECSPSFLMGWDENPQKDALVIDKAIAKKYGSDVLELLTLYIRLDNIDRGSVLERIRMFLEQDKYSRQKGVLDA